MKVGEGQLSEEFREEEEARREGKELRIFRLPLGVE